MNISKSAFSLSKDEYEGTGKRLFIGLVIGTAILLCVLLLLIWLVPTIGFAAIHPWLPFIAGIAFGGAILGILWLSVGLVAPRLYRKALTRHRHACAESPYACSCQSWSSWAG